MCGSSDIQTIWQQLGVDLELHDQLLNCSHNAHTKTHLWQKNRPEGMKHFDDALHASHAGRVKEIYEYRKQGGKSLGSFCIYVPEEIALAANVLIIPLCGGSGWSVSYADKMLPRDICPLIRSTFGMSFSNTCPYKKLKDGAVGETTCDAKKKAWDLFGFKVLEVPQRKNKIDRELWLHEVYDFKVMVENLSGVNITSESLRDAIVLFNRKRKALQRINEFRKLPEPPISGLDSLLISQVALNQDIHQFITNAEALIEELEQRAAQGISAYDRPGTRIMIGGSPAAMGNAKVHHLLESARLRIVVDESCTGVRYYRNFVDESATDLDGMMKAVADRYFNIDCSCFSPNRERIDNVVKLIQEFNVQGMIHYILQYCHGYNIEAKILEKALKEQGIPSLIIETDYSEEDTGQILTRIEAFAEVLSDVS